MAQLNRRIFLLSGLAATAATAATPARALSASPFTLGVASGEPSTDGFVLWTRLAVAPLNGDGLGGMPNRDVEVRWEVSENESFAPLAASGTVLARPSDAHTVHVEVGGLKAGAKYFYRFISDGHESPQGTVGTAPSGLASKLTFAFASCAHYEHGFFHAYRYMAQDKPDLVLFLGDYIYEAPWRTSAGPVPNPSRKYLPRKEVTTLAEYRLRYAQHRMDPNLQAAHAAAPWLVVFDDHEVENNWAADHRGDNDPAGDFKARKTAALRAFYENMPLRAAQRPTGTAIPLYRRVSWGQLARFHMLDTRQYRWKQAAAKDCGVIRDPRRTLTGDVQEKWLLDGLAQPSARWDFLGQQVFFAQRDDDGKPATCDVSTDAWDGYPHSRDRIVQGWLDRKVRNPIVLTGDVHRHWAANIKQDYFAANAPVVGTEFVVGSITSPNDGVPGAAYLKANPHLRFVSQRRGYAHTTVTPEKLTTQYVTVSNALEPNPAKVTRSVAKTYTVADGKPGLG
ncbi:alkaline phosphatase D family protein [Allokutzneria multivorans]|uniref:Alkaline phosphatase D family protein n=1 Tax=Allokutzneria multivorans TaxID=1142134 RepID=A0ABP7S7J2_9PSEU